MVFQSSICFKAALLELRDWKMKMGIVILEVSSSSTTTLGEMLIVCVRAHIFESLTSRLGFADPGPCGKVRSDVWVGLLPTYSTLPLRIQTTTSQTRRRHFALFVVVDSSFFLFFCSLY